MRDPSRGPIGPSAASARRRVPLSRAAVVLRLTDRLRKHGWPRLQMTAMVALTGLAGWLLSAALLHLGLHSMMLRWPLALLGAWGVFLVMLGLWVRLQRDSLEAPELENVFDAADLLSEVRLPRMGGGGRGSGPGGGRFGGAGAQGEAGPAADDLPMPVVGVMDANAGAEADTGGSSGLDLDLPDLGDSDELMVPVLLIVLAVGMAAASLYVIWTAPTLLAELLFDGAISYGLYRRLRADDTRDWLGTALRHTALPFAVTAVLLAGVGWGLHKVHPEARTIAQALHPDRIPDRRP